MVHVFECYQNRLTDTSERVYITVSINVYMKQNVRENKRY